MFSRIHPRFEPGNRFPLAAQIEAKAVGLISLRFHIRRQSGPDALQLVADSFLYDQSDRIAELALARGLPTLASAVDVAYEGALLAYGLSVTEVYRRSAYYVKRILDGASPADLSVEQPTRIRLVINLKTAKALAFDVPVQLLARADEVIE